MADSLASTSIFSDEEYENLYNHYYPESNYISTVKQCTTGVTASVSPVLTSILVHTLIQRIVLTFENVIPRKLIDLFIGLQGTYLLYENNVNPIAIGICLAFFIVGFAGIKIFRTWPYLGPWFTVASLAGICGIQASIDGALFLSFRGSLMILAMKLISLAFDVHQREYESISIFQAYGYIFNPATYFYGLFTPFKSYEKASGFKNVTKVLNSLLLASFCLLLAGACLIYSDCVLGSLLADNPVFQDFIISVRDYLDTDLLETFEKFVGFINAQSFRFSNYFVLYFVWATALIGGFESNKMETVNAAKVEFPRSMDEVVRYWNLSLHEFLHTYIYTKTKSISRPIAIILTFAASALLHGTNFQIGSVLISLSGFGIAESVFRSKLAHHLNLCIKSRPCKDNCGHRTGYSIWTTLATKLLNFVFMLINIGTP
uniref:Protein-serine O-palmitoleoyltransferase porcupine n=1 Tax=Panagrellus redivivus TaxID=6233 RepID=A0A7E4WBT2_PANRE